MKSNDNQKLVIDALSSHIESWATTNDINSSSHWSLNSEWYVGLNIDLQDELEDTNLSKEIESRIDELLSLIRKIK